jgi:phosphoribosylformylglycinamidine synthase
VALAADAGGLIEHGGDSGSRIPDPGGASPTPSDAVATLFGESASRVVVSVRPDDRASLLQMAADAGVPARIIGRTGGSSLRIAVGGQPAIECTVAEAEQVWAGAIERHFAGRAA